MAGCMALMRHTFRAGLGGKTCCSVRFCCSQLSDVQGAYEPTANVLNSCSSSALLTLLQWLQSQSSALPNP